MIDFTNKWLYGAQQRKLVNNDFTSIIDVNLYKSLKHFYYWGLSIYNKSYSLRIKNQLQTGLGVAYNFIDRKNFKINVSDGILFDYADVYLQDSTRDIYQTPRNSFRLQVKYYYTSLLSFSGAIYIQHSLQYRSDIIYKSDVDMGIRLRKWLSLTAKLTYNKVNRTARENLFVTFGLVFDKYF